MTITLLSPPRPTLKPISTAQAADQRPLMRFAIPEDYFPPGQGVPLSWATTADWPRAWPFRGPSRPLAARRGSLLCPEEPRVPAHGPAKRGGGLFAGAGPRKARRAGRDNSRQRPGPAKTAYPAQGIIQCADRRAQHLLPIQLGPSRSGCNARDYRSAALR